MGLFVEVKSVDKGCDVIINLDEVIEIAPLAAGGCVLFFADQSSPGGRTSFKVEDSYEQFRQFAIMPVSAEDIAKRFPKATKKAADTIEIPKFGEKV
jgi:hypothetical protein